MTMYNYFVVRFTNRADGTSGNSVKPYENEGDAVKEFFRQAGQAVDFIGILFGMDMPFAQHCIISHGEFLPNSKIPGGGKPPPG